MARTVSIGAGELSRPDLAGLVLHGVDNPTALANVVRGLTEEQLRDGFYELAVLFSIAVRHADEMPPRRFLEGVVATWGNVPPPG